MEEPQLSKNVPIARLHARTVKWHFPPEPRRLWTELMSIQVSGTCGQIMSAGFGRNANELIGGRCFPAGDSNWKNRLSLFFGGCQSLVLRLSLFFPRGLTFYIRPHKFGSPSHTQRSQRRGNLFPISPPDSARALVSFEYTLITHNGVKAYHCASVCIFRPTTYCISLALGPFDRQKRQKRGNSRHQEPDPR